MVWAAVGSGGARSKTALEKQKTAPEKETLIPALSDTSDLEHEGVAGLGCQFNANSDTLARAPTQNRILCG